MGKKNRSNRVIEGNTNTSITKQPNKCKRWCFTWNNYPENEPDNIIELFNKLNIQYIIGKEIGKIGNIKHLQGYIECPTYMRWTEFGLPKQIHWEKCKGSRHDNVEYCSKEGQYSCSNILRKHFVQTLCTNTLYPWQKNIESLFHTEPDGRSIHWYYDEEGGKGKSAFCKYMYVVHKVPTIQGGKMADVINIMFNLDLDEVRMVLIDIPRSTGNKISYGAIECILNGMITNTKFETGIKVFNPPHVVVFANKPPNESKLSEDRWKVTEL